MEVDGSLKGVSGRDAVCGWAVVQLDYDEEEEPWYAIYGPMVVELDVQGSIRRQSYGLSLCHLQA